MRRTLSILIAAGLLLIIAVLVIYFSCAGSHVTPEAIAPEGPSPHSLSQEDQDRLIAETKEDLDLVASAGADATVLPQALTGQALEDMKANLAADLAQGKYKKREYQNITVVLQDYAPSLAQMSAEFDDASYYVDAKTGAALEAPVRTHKAYALAVVEEDNRWKIKYVLAPKGTSTQQVNPGG